MRKFFGRSDIGCTSQDGDGHAYLTPTCSQEERKQFNKQWQEGRPWLLCKEGVSPDGLCYEEMHCALCTKWNAKRNIVWVRTGCRTLHLDAIKEHEESKQHKESVARDLTNYDSLGSMSMRIDTNEYQSILDAMKVLHFLIKYNLAYTTLFKPLIELCVDVGAVNLPYLHQGDTANYTIRRTVDDLMECQAKVIEEEIITKLKDSESYGLMCEEYTDSTSRKHFALIVKFMDHGVPNLSFLQDLELPNGNSDIVYSSMKEYLQEKNIPLKNLATFASDGPSVMLGKKSGIAEQLKRDHPHVINVPCINNRLMLAVFESLGEVSKVESVDKMLLALFKYYHYNNAKTENLHAIRDILCETEVPENSSTLATKDAVYTSWVSHENAVQTVRKLYIAICRDLEHTVADRMETTLGDEIGIPEKSILNMLKTYENVYFTHLLCDVRCGVASLKRLFENEHVDLTMLTPKLQATIFNLQKLKRQEGPYTSKTEQVCSLLEIKVNPELIADSRDKFLDLIVEKLEERLEGSDILTGLAALDLSHVPECQATFHGDQEISLLAEQMRLDVDRTLGEWTELKEVFRDDLKHCTPSQILSTLIAKQNYVGCLYPNIMNMLMVHQTLILSTAPVERMFQTVKRLVNEDQNRQDVETINNMLNVAINTTSKSDIDMDRVVRLFIDKRKTKPI